MKLSLIALPIALVFGLASAAPRCNNSRGKFTILNGRGKEKKKNCGWVKKDTSRCEMETVDGDLLKDLCRKNCDNCAISSPVPSPTNAPVPNPTNAPVPLPTNPPEPLPTAAPNGNGCCTMDYKQCIDWCGDTEESCNNCENPDVGWLSNGEPNGTCMSRWTDCNADRDGCCDGLTCQFQDNYYGCFPGNDTPTPPNPTNPPVPNPTDAPVPNPTDAPVPNPTNSPVPNPTNAPVPNPTDAPVPSPTDAPVFPPTNPPNNDGCCSQDYKTCVSGCGPTYDNCMNCGDVVWLPGGEITEQCGERWSGCNENNDNGHNGCCDGLTCQFRDGYGSMACLPGDGNPTPTPPQPNPTNPPEPTPESSPVSEPTGGGSGSGDMTAGKATMYGGNESGNACGYIDLPKVTFPRGFSVAIGSDTFDDGYGCGACFEVTCTGAYGNNPNCFCGDGDQKSVIVQATDQCPECDDNHFDLNTEAFTSIVKDQSPAMAGTCGIITTEYRRVSCDFKSNIKIRSKSGTSGYWYGLHIDDVAGYGAISEVKLREAGRRMNGQDAFDIVCRKSQGASFWFCDRPNDREIFANLDVELTDSAGRKLTNDNVITNLNGGQEFDFGKNYGPIPTGPVEPTAAPVIEPTPAPVPTPAPAPTEPFNGELLSTDNAMNAWEVYQGLALVTQKNSENPPKYAYVSSGGAAGDGGYVVSEGQAYGLLITGTVLASWDTHAGQVPGANRAEVLKYFEGYYNFWKEMCKNSSNNPNSNCQWNGKFCKSGSDSYVCLPDWKHRSGGGSAETGPAPDGDEDAIVGIMLAVKAVENDNNRPSWYDEARKWADASATALFEFEVDKSKPDFRMLKLGSCWGGWESSGNNPSYHSPGSYRVMRDYQNSFPDSDRVGYDAVPQSEWTKLIDTSYGVLGAVQCSDDGALVPNWATVGVENGNIIHTGGSFSGSGTGQYEYGAEAARTTFRVALDAVFYPEKSSEWSPFLSEFNYRLEQGYNNGSFSSNSFPSCRGPRTNSDIYMFGDWQNNSFIYGPTYTALVGASPGVGESMIDAAGTILGDRVLPDSYYPRSWAMISNLMLNGAMESAGNTLKQ